MPNDFGFINNEFINLYSKDNPILNSGDSCYFLMTNNSDYHRPLICKGNIIMDLFSDGLNKDYYIELTEILETPKVKCEFVLGAQFTIFPYIDEVLLNRKLIVINENTNFNKNLFKIEAFFIRNNYEKIVDLRNEYIKIIKSEMLKQISEIDEIQ
ncbi:hypothetical protein M0Q97_13730 [Candidatus Dojkabacteria bacterium]|jgi:hypothetical protein|nr:hypothetical protein [Candidatus Dojkabacteria bacterium]